MERIYEINYVDDSLWPAVGTGRRTVVAKVGHKWVWVRERGMEKYKNFKRVRRSVWDKLQVQERK